MISRGLTLWDWFTLMVWHSEQLSRCESRTTSNWRPYWISLVWNSYQQKRVYYECADNQTHSLLLLVGQVAWLDSGQKGRQEWKWRFWSRLEETGGRISLGDSIKKIANYNPKIDLNRSKQSRCVNADQNRTVRFVCSEHRLHPKKQFEKNRIKSYFK